MLVIYMFILYIYNNIFKNKFCVNFILLYVTFYTNNIILITVIAQRERLTILFQRKRFSGGQLKQTGEIRTASHPPLKKVLQKFITVFCLVILHFINCLNLSCNYQIRQAISSIN